MKFKLKIFIFIILLISLIGCSNANIKYQTISPDNAYNELKEDKSIIILDVRTYEEYISGHILGSILLPLDEMNETVLSVVTNKNIKIFVYCRSGNRSKIAAKELIELGYTNVYDLGGIVNWPYDIVK